MKILKIAFRNLNSLVGPHEIDLADGVLSSAGIFAITGPTGAGKSTILDAITLALYGRAARYGSTPNPEDMMSRHTGECSAEVEFEVAAGRFRAAWHLNRARKKADGKVQPARRYLYDSGGQTLAQKSRDMDSQIEDLIGLDADRFLRSVLLAQNDFAKFLKAQPDERATLLESLTGTEIYSRLGRLAHEKLVEKEKQLAAEEEQVRHIAILSPEDRDKTEVEIADGETRSKELGDAIESLRESVELGHRLTTLLDEQRKLTEARQKLDLRSNEFDVQRQRLARHQQASVYREAVHSIDVLVGQVETAEQSARNARSDLQQKAGRFRAAVTTAAVLAERLVKDAVDKSEKLSKDRDDSEREKRTLADWMNEHSADSQLATAIGDIGASLERLRGQRKSQHERTVNRDGLLKKRDTSEKQLEELRKKHELAVGKAEGLTSQLEEASRAYELLADGQTIAEVDQATTQLRDRFRDLGDLKRDVEALAKEERKLAECNTSIQEGEVACKRTDEEFRAAEALLKKQTELVDARRESRDRGRLVASLSENREHLRPGEWCPLCGALEHPFATDSPIEDSALRQDEENLEAAKTEHKRLETELSAAKEAHGKATFALEESRKRQGQLKSSIEQASDNVAKKANELDVSEPSLVTVEALLEQTTSLGKSMAEKLKNMREADKLISSRDKDFTTAQSDVKLSKAKVEAEDATLKSLLDDITTAEVALASSNVDVEAAEADIENRLQAFLPPGQRVPEPGQEEPLRASLAARSTAWTTKEGKQRTIDAALAGFKLKLESLESDRKKFESAAQRYQQTIKSHDVPSESEEADAQTSPSDFAPLIVQWEVEWKSLDDADQEIESCRSERDTAGGLSKERDQAAESLRAKLANSRSDLNSKLAETVFADINSLRDALLSDVEVQEIEREDNALKNAVAEHGGEQKRVHGEIDELQRAQAVTGEDLTLKRELLQTQQDELEELKDQIAQHRATLRTDDANRKLVEERQQHLAEEKKSLESWRRLKGLIGSSDGKKFRLFAQGLSLDVLVRLANKHLRKLSERYRLQRIAGETLDLEIVDEHQAGTRRPMQSLSGGESFVASLALALGLSDLAGRNVRIDSLFIDEGFGSLDPDTLDIAVAALEGLQSNQKTIGVISHVELLKERITTQIQVTPAGGGVSRLKVVG